MARASLARQASIPVDKAVSRSGDVVLAYLMKIRGMRLDEAKEINKSLTTLGRVIDCLINKAPHIPYRDSNLTRLLANSLGGNARCALCVNVSPSSWNYAESLSTLFFGCRTRAMRQISSQSSAAHTHTTGTCPARVPLH